MTGALSGRRVLPADRARPETSVQGDYTSRSTRCQVPRRFLRSPAGTLGFAQAALSRQGRPAAAGSQGTGAATSF